MRPQGLKPALILERYAALHAFMGFSATSEAVRFAKVFPKLIHEL
jgi:hypothetical protein